MSSHVPKGIVPLSSILINFVIALDVLDLRHLLVSFWRENRQSSSPGLELTSFRFSLQCIHHLANVHSLNGDFVHETLISRVLNTQSNFCNKLKLLNNCFRL